MFPKKLRVPINLFPKNSKTVFSDSCVLIKASPNNLPYSRLGVLLGKRVLKGSVSRNKLRRRVLSYLSEPFLSTKNESIKAPNDLLIIAKAPMINLTKEELKNRFQRYGKFV